jgi:hypothetical protein
LDLAKTLENDKYKIRALRGYIRIARQLGMSTGERIAMGRTAMDVAERDDERKLVFDVLRRNPSAEALSMAVSHLNQRSLRGPATQTAVSIAEQIVGAHPAAVAEAMKQVLQASRNKNLLARAKELLEQASK